MAFCRKCGNQLIEGKKFCNKCGVAVVRVAPTATPKPEPVYSPVQAEAAVAAPTPVSMPVAAEAVVKAPAVVAPAVPIEAPQARQGESSKVPQPFVPLILIGGGWKKTLYKLISYIVSIGVGLIFPIAGLAEGNAAYCIAFIWFLFGPIWSLISIPACTTACFRTRKSANEIRTICKELFSGKKWTSYDTGEKTSLCFELSLSVYQGPRIKLSIVPDGQGCIVVYSMDRVDHKTMNPAMPLMRLFGGTASMVAFAWGYGFMLSCPFYMHGGIRLLSKKNKLRGLLQAESAQFPASLQYGGLCEWINDDKKHSDIYKCEITESGTRKSPSATSQKSAASEKVPAMAGGSGTGSSVAPQKQAIAASDKSPAQKLAEDYEAFLLGRGCERGHDYEKSTGMNTVPYTAIERASGDAVFIDDDAPGGDEDAVRLMIFLPDDLTIPEDALSVTVHLPGVGRTPVSDVFKIRFNQKMNQSGFRTTEGTIELFDDLIAIPQIEFANMGGSGMNILLVVRIPGVANISGAPMLERCFVEAGDLANLALESVEQTMSEFR